ncbi:CD209 antigen-like protein C [Rhineura floridana]|uniref:CD209 antigen-like protein C n=1 Tax=Rhineura floridana TaxID=261503 RepID=UPI002AC858C0|nr:CD209 antigen-like protein C [Rhineura floridana]
MYDDTEVPNPGKVFQLYGRTCCPLPPQPREKTGNIEEVYEDFDKESDYDCISLPLEKEEPKAPAEPPGPAVTDTAQSTSTPTQWKGCWRNCIALLLALVGLLIDIILLSQHAAIFFELRKLNISSKQESCSASTAPLTVKELKITFLKELKMLEKHIDERSEASNRKVEEQISRIEGKMSTLKNRKDTCKEPDPLSWHQFQGSCYYFSDNEKQWEDARTWCSTYNSHLVIINSKTEQDFVVKRIKLTSVWLGANDIQMEGNWHWIDGSPLGQRFWKPGEPNNVGGHEDCAVLHREGNWNDIACNREVHFVCEKTVVSVLP